MRRSGVSSGWKAVASSGPCRTATILPVCSSVPRTATFWPLCSTQGARIKTARSGVASAAQQLIYGTFLNPYSDVYSLTMLPGGLPVIAGIATDDVHPDKLLGALYQPFVSIAVGLILFEAGLRLSLDEIEPGVRKAVARHLQEHPHFWQIFPGALTHRIRRWWAIQGLRKLTHLPATFAGVGVTTIACWRAHRVLREGVTQYWPKATRRTILTVPQMGTK